MNNSKLFFIFHALWHLTYPFLLIFNFFCHLKINIQFLVEISTCTFKFYCLLNFDAWSWSTYRCLPRILRTLFSLWKVVRPRALPDLLCPTVPARVIARQAFLLFPASTVTGRWYARRPSARDRGLLRRWSVLSVRCKASQSCLRWLQSWHVRCDHWSRVSRPE